MSQVFRANLKSLSRTFVSLGTSTKVYNGIAIAVPVTCGVTYCFMHTYFQYKYQEIVQMYPSGIAAELSPELQKLSKEVFDESNIPQRYRIVPNFVKFFPVIGTEPFGIGSMECPTGVSIGLPYNFNYNKIEDVKSKDINVLGQHDPNTKWQSDAGKQLIESFVLSENAKKFAIAREIHHSNTFRVHINTIVIIVSSFFAFFTGPQIIEKLKIDRKRVILRNFIRINGFAFGFLVWCALHDALNHHWQLYADAMTVQQGIDYYNGGVEFYKKQRQRHKACHFLYEERGEKYFTSDGEIRSFFRKKNVPIKERIAKLREAYAMVTESDVNQTDEKINE